MFSFKFGTDGWRAKIAREFTFANCRMVIQGIASYVKQNDLSKNGIVVAYDNRFLAEEFARESCQVLAGNGIKTYLLRKAAPTPLAAFAIRHLNAGGAVVITASHNPPAYSGIKFIPYYAGPAMPDISNAIEGEIQRVLETGKVYDLDLHEAEKLEIFSELELDKEYMSALLRVVNGNIIKERGVKVLVDPMYGSGMGYLEKILGNLGCEVKAINNYRDPLFGGMTPEPIEEQLCDLKRAVLSYKAGLGIALDGDGDRFGIVDHEGQFVNTNIMLAIILNYLLKNKAARGPICRTVGTTRLLDKMAKKYELPLIETPVGFKYVSEALREKNCLFGGEESGGLSIIGHIPEKDGILAGLLAVEVLAATGKNLTQLQEELFAEFGSVYPRRYDIQVPEHEFSFLSEKIKNYNPKQIGDYRIVSVSNADEVLIHLEDKNWILLRLSGTESMCRIYIETNYEYKNKELQNAILKDLNI